MLTKVKDWDLANQPKETTIWPKTGRGTVQRASRVTEFKDESDWLYFIGVHASGFELPDDDKDVAQIRGFVGFNPANRHVYAAYSLCGTHLHCDTLRRYILEQLAEEDRLDLDHAHREGDVSLSIFGLGEYLGPHCLNRANLIHNGFSIADHDEGIIDFTQGMLAEIHNIYPIPGKGNILLHTYREGPGVGPDTIEFQPGEVNAEQLKNGDRSQSALDYLVQAAKICKRRDDSKVRYWYAMPFELNGSQIHVRNLARLQSELANAEGHIAIAYQTHGDLPGDPIPLENIMDAITLQPNEPNSRITFLFTQSPTHEQEKEYKTLIGNAFSDYLK